MRGYPRSLYGRLVLALVLVLFTAQLVSIAVLLQDRDQVLYQATGLASAQRIIGIVRLLDPMGPEERKRAVRALDVAPLHLTLTRVSLPASNAETTAIRAAYMSGMLRRQLGDRLLQVSVRDVGENAAQPNWAGREDPPEQPGGMIGRQMANAGLVPGPHLSFLVQVALSDGAVVTFDHLLPEEIFAWPWRMIGSLAILLATAILVSFLAVRWLTRPLSTLAQAADELGRDIQRPPLAERGPNEVVQAARAFNQMQARLVRFIEDRARILAAVSHDMKTPITRLRLRTEMLPDEQVQAKFRQDLDDMESMVRDTLDFMRGIDSHEQAAPLDLNALVESLQADFEETGWEVTIEGAAASPYPCRPLALKRCLANLMENAHKYGNEVRVQLEDSPGQLIIRVLDRGPGIPEDQLDKVFDPFYRLEGSRSRQTGGSGLGLSIARNTARAHGGELTLHNRQEGGLEARLTLPR